MTTTLENIRAAFGPYLSDKIELVEIPEDILALLEDANDAAKGTAESIEGVLALYAANKISQDSLKKQLRALLSTEGSMALSKVEASAETAMVLLPNALSRFGSTGPFQHLPYLYGTTQQLSIFASAQLQFFPWNESGNATRPNPFDVSSRTVFSGVIDLRPSVAA